MRENGGCKDLEERPDQLPDESVHTQRRRLTIPSLSLCLIKGSWGDILLKLPKIPPFQTVPVQNVSAVLSYLNFLCLTAEEPLYPFTLLRDIVVG